MDNKTNVYTLDVSEKTFNDVQANKFYITDTKNLKAGDYILFRVVVFVVVVFVCFCGGFVLFGVCCFFVSFVGLEN